MTDPRTAEALNAEQVDEWNTYAALVPIDYYGQRAFNPGDKVPVSSVDGDAAWIDPSWVARIGSGDVPPSQTAPPPEPPQIDPAVAAAPPSAAAPPPDGSGVVDLTPDK